MYDHLVDIWNMSHVKMYQSDWGLEFHPTKLYYKGMLGDLLYGRADVAGLKEALHSNYMRFFRYFGFGTSTIHRTLILLLLGVGF